MYYSSLLEILQACPLLEAPYASLWIIGLLEAKGNTYILEIFFSDIS